MSDYILELKGITKIFPGVKALDKVNFQLKKGQIHALMGENGAGKSTFIKVITGVHQPEEGEIFLNGEKISFRNPKEAQKQGIAAIYQHVTSYPHLSVTENIFMGHEEIDPKTKRILWGKMHKKAQELLEELGAEFSPKTLMSALSVAQQQMVEIAKAISTNAKIIIMDEPTAALTKKESEELYKITEKLRDSGVSIIFISHRFEDMYRLASKVTVFRDSKYIGSWDVDGITNEDLIVAMVGREITQLYPEKTSKPGEELLRVEGLGKMGYFKDISFNVKKGEILGFTGLVGAGRTEVFQAIFGVIPYDEGKIYMEGKEVSINKPIKAMNLGIGYLPEDRQKEGLILEWAIGDNITLPTISHIAKKGWLRPYKEKKLSKRLADKVNVKATSIFDLASSLSGGNQQKVVVAKLLAKDLKLIIMDEPTKGVDVGAKSAIYEIMNDLASQGYGVIMVSSEMPEVLGMSDRVVVMKEGRITKELKNDGKITQEMILEAAMYNQKMIKGGA
ncbi:MAG: sugar ABC transporter ATP-binding protein [Eubacteriales bacterium]